MSNKIPRLRRLFNKSGNCFDVAIDHGFFNEISFLDGIENMDAAIKTIVEASPDAIQLSPGQARLLQSISGKDKPALVLRTDIANCYGKKLPDKLFSQMIKEPVEQAIILDADCMVVNLLLLPGQPGLLEQCIANACLLKSMCDRYGMPLMIEPLVMQANEKAGGYMVDGDIQKILPLVRQAAELGADIIKADPCDNPQDYHKVIAVAGVPVLVRGGGKATEKEIFDRIVYGRNVIQHPKPKLMTRALMAIVHEKADTATAIKILSTPVS